MVIATLARAELCSDHRPPCGRGTIRARCAAI